jgi:hypothetical protein
MNKAVAKSISLKIVFVLAWVVTTLKGVTCEQLSEFQSKLPDDVANWGLWVSFAVAMLLSWWQVKRSEAAHKQ